MRLCDAAFLVVFAAVSGLLVFAAEVLALPKKKPPQLAAVADVADLTSRAASYRWHVSSFIDRVTTVPTVDAQSNDDAVLQLVEFDDGRLGIYLARPDAENDACLVLSKDQMPLFREAFGRCEQR